MLQPQNILFNLNLLETNTRFKNKQKKQEQKQKRKNSTIWNKTAKMQPTPIYFIGMLSSPVVIMRHSELRIKNLEDRGGLAWLKPLHVALHQP